MVVVLVMVACGWGLVKQPGERFDTHKQASRSNTASAGRRLASAVETSAISTPIASPDCAFALIEARAVTPAELPSLEERCGRVAEAPGARPCRLVRTGGNAAACDRRAGDTALEAMAHRLVHADVSCAGKGRVTSSNSDSPTRGTLHFCCSRLRNSSNYLRAVAK